MTERLRVTIVGAGLSGIGMAWHLQQHCPQVDFELLEARSELGGTWSLFRYPGIRSDSDMHTLGYHFKPWTDSKAIADGQSILQYLKDTVAENDIERHIRYGHKVSAARWDSSVRRWCLEVDTPDGSITQETNVLLMCSGYYSYRGGHRPDFPGEADFQGPILHPQDWPDDLEVAGKNVTVIGSGATAITLVPALASLGAQVTMLQRSPTYVVARPDTDVWANRLRRVLPEQLAYRFTRAKNTWRQQTIYKRTRSHPDKVREYFLKMTKEEVGDVCDVDKHFTPAYNPWDERLCLSPNGDLFEALRDGTASVVTDTIERFGSSGIETASGGTISADVIVTATGLELVTLGEMDFSIDGELVDFSERITYKGVAYSNMPNLISTFGYINASWTLRSDLIAQYACAVINAMSASNADVFCPTLDPGERAAMELRPWISDFSPGYMRRMLPSLPKQATHEPWVNYQNLKDDRRLLSGDVQSDDVLVIS